MFNEDADFKKLLPIAPAIISDLRDEFGAKFEIVVKEFKHLVLKKSAEKDEEIAMIQRCLNGVKKTSDKHSLERLEVYSHQKKEV